MRQDKKQRVTICVNPANGYTLFIISSVYGSDFRF